MQMTKSPNKLIGLEIAVIFMLEAHSGASGKLMQAEKSMGRPAIPFVGGQRLSHVMREAVKSSLWSKLMSLRYCP